MVEKIGEKIATIETDKIDVAVNAPKTGIIKESLVNEEDTVTVEQDLVKLEPSGSPGSVEKKSDSSEQEAMSNDQPTSSEPETLEKDESATAPPAEEKKPEYLTQEQPKKNLHPPSRQNLRRSLRKQSQSRAALHHR